MRHRPEFDIQSAFARPAEAASVPNTGSAPLRWAAIGAAAIALIVAGILLSQGQGASHNKNARTAAPHAAPASHPIGHGVLLGMNKRPLSYYTGSVRPTLFSAPPPPLPKKAAKPVVKPKPPVIPKVPPMIINPFADWAYKGTIKTASKTFALIENGTTHEGQYVSVGDSFMGAQVTQVTDQMVVLSSAGKPTVLAKSDAITVTPLDKSAPFLGGGSTPAAPSPAPNAPSPPPMPPQMEMPMAPQGMFGRGVHFMTGADSGRTFQAAPEGIESNATISISTP